MSDDDAVRVLLERHKCPIPFHEVRTRILGSIAAPVPSVPPTKVMASLWGGEPPTFDPVEAADEPLGALVMGLWNRLTRHQERKSPLRLMRNTVRPTREGLREQALTRRQELDGFVDGLFAGEPEINLPERAHRAIGLLTGMRARFAAVAHAAPGASGLVTKKERMAAFASLRPTTLRAEREIHAIMMSCALARRRSLATLTISKPPVLQ